MIASGIEKKNTISGECDGWVQILRLLTQVSSARAFAGYIHLVVTSRTSLLGESGTGGHKGGHKIVFSMTSSRMRFLSQILKQTFSLVIKS